MSLTNHEIIKLWTDEELPYSEQTLPQDIPTLQVVLPSPEKSNKATVIVLPGGGYTNLASHEGLPVAEWLAGAGYTAFVLSYRRGPHYPHPIPLTDARRALRLVRSNATEWQLEPDKIGILGFSAGGHLASTAANHFTDPGELPLDSLKEISARPDFHILIYPVITMGPGAHEGSRTNLLGDKLSPELIQALSNETRVTSATPPAFLFHSTLDEGVKVANSDNYVASLKAAGVPYRYIRGEFGGHGIGLHPCWTTECLNWLQTSVN